MGQNKKRYPKRRFNPYVRFTSIALQMGLTIYLGSKLGAWLDFKFVNTNQLYYKIVTLLTIFISTYSVIKQVIKVTNNKP